MRSICFALALSCASFVIANESPNSPENIERSLQQAQADFQRANQIFIPWYTGPLITGSAKNVSPGHINIQAYLYFTDNYAVFNDNRRSISQKDIFVINPSFIFQYGITSWLDVTASAQGFFKWRGNQSAQHFGDTSVSFGIPLLIEKMYQPAMRLTFGETFPTGTYRSLSVKKPQIDSTGAGVFSTSVGLNLSKTFWWNVLHPTNIRFASSYSFPNNQAYVRGFNAYGGGYGTDGHVKVGQSLNLDIGIEVSITQRLVFATDLAYTYSAKSTFSGTSGVDSAGKKAVNGAPSSDNLSISPAIEYNVSKTGGFIGGIWLPITGRNSSNFISLVLSYTQYF